MTDPIGDWVEKHKNDRVFGYLLKHRSATIAELAAVGGLSIDAVIADMGGLHDYGIVTRYGNKAWSRVSLDYRVGRDV